ncbi:DUF4352 domain-containing protein [Bacillus shivajii]|uniref:DUF4352 domain-containing protein n=1 Tax=Bacillus shivajii TaxID=1983719 RepID=UPI001CFA6236|nr:DUF4352 domain-containing protein [Bacillus shivajii]UCZ52638.1 DUF4352 domain-containing protein [Bacillus shivajii]
MKKIMFLVLATALVACGGEAEIERVDDTEEDIIEDVETGTTEDEGEVEDIVEPEEEKEEEVEEDLSIGDAVMFNGVQITLDDVRIDHGTDEWDAPNNDQYVIVHLTIENTLEESYNVSSMLQMSLFDEEHYSQDLAFMADTKGSLDGELGPGRTMRGEVAFDADESNYYEFIFEDPFTSGQAIWEFEINEDS